MSYAKLSCRIVESSPLVCLLEDQSDLGLIIGETLQCAIQSEGRVQDKVVMANVVTTAVCATEVALIQDLFVVGSF